MSLNEQIRILSGAKASVDFAGFIGTTEVVPVKTGLIHSEVS
jgi:hypothetical protein